MSNQKDLTGQTFGRLTVMGEAEKRNQKRYWECRCECGNVTEVRQDNLLGWRTESCGCQQGKGGAGIPRNRKPTKWYDAAKVWRDSGDPSAFLDYIEAQEGADARANWEGLIDRLTPDEIARIGST